MMTEAQSNFSPKEPASWLFLNCLSAEAACDQQMSNFNASILILSATLLLSSPASLACTANSAIVLA